MNNQYLIWSDEHGAWWKPNATGYTRKLNEAGRYTLQTATEICQEANQYSDPVHEIIFPLPLDPITYTCPVCGRVSYNPNDIQERYCGYCHTFEQEWRWNEQLNAQVIVQTTPQLPKPRSQLEDSFSHTHLSATIKELFQSELNRLQTEDPTL